MPSLKWYIIKSVPAYSNISKKCQLCLQEKFKILSYPNPNELLSKITFQYHFSIIFLKLLELHSTIFEKNIFVTNFPFLTDSLRSVPHPLNGQNPLSITKVLSMLPQSHDFKNLISSKPASKHMQLVMSNSFEKSKTIASLSILFVHISDFF